EACRLHEILWSVAVMGINPPQAAVLGIDLRPGKGEVIVRLRHHLAAGPFAALQGKVEKAGVLARGRVDAGVALVERTELAVAAEAMPPDLLHADRREDALLQISKQVLACRVLEDQDEMSNAGVAV